MANQKKKKYIEQDIKTWEMKTKALCYKTKQNKKLYNKPDLEDKKISRNQI